MSHLTECLGLSAQLYNMAFVVIVIVLFVILFRIKNKKRFITPWKFIFAALCTYIVEQVASILNSNGVLQVPKILFPLLEMAIISLFIYALLTQKEHLKNRKVIEPKKKGKK